MILMLCLKKKITNYSYAWTEVAKCKWNTSPCKVWNNKWKRQQNNNTNIHSDWMRNHKKDMVKFISWILCGQVRQKEIHRTTRLTNWSTITSNKGNKCRQQYIDTYILNINTRKRIIIQHSNVLVKEMENVNTHQWLGWKEWPERTTKQVLSKYYTEPDMGTNNQIESNVFYFPSLNSGFCAEKDYFILDTINNDCN